MERDQRIAEMKASGYFEPRLMKPGSKAIVETDGDHLYTIQIVDPTTSVVLMYSTHERLRDYPAKRAFFVGSRTGTGNQKSNLTFPDLVVKGARMLFRFSDIDFLSSPVKTARIEGSGWHYEVIQ